MSSITRHFAPCVLASVMTGMAFGTAPANAQEPSPAVIESILACRSIEDAAQRLDCLDRATTDLASAMQREEIVVVERHQAVAAERDSFGLSFMNPGRVLSSIVGRTSTASAGLQVYDDGVEAVRRSDGEIDILRNLPVRSVTSDRNGRMVVTLENGTVWRQTDARRVQLPRSADGLTLEVNRASMGSYFMSLSNSSVRVRAQRD